MSISCMQLLMWQCMQEGKYAGNSAGEVVPGARAGRVVTDRIVLNHYVTKSLEQYQQKMSRGSGMGNRKSMEFFDLTQLMATENCTYAVNLGQPQEQQQQRQLQHQQEQEQGAAAMA